MSFIFPIVFGKTSRDSENAVESTDKNALEDLNLRLMDDLWAKIFSYLRTYKDLNSLQLTCKRWGKLLLKREIIALDSLQFALSNYGGNRVFKIITQPLINLSENSSLLAIREVVSNEMKNNFLSNLINPEDGELEDGEIILLTNKTNGLMPIDWENIFLILEFAKKLKSITPESNPSEIDKITTLFSELLTKDPLGTAMAVRLLPPDKTSVLFSGENMVRLETFFEEAEAKHCFLGVTEWAQLIPNISDKSIGHLRLITEELIGKRFVKETLDIAKLMPTTSRDGIEAIRFTAIHLIHKEFVKEALDLAKLMPSTFFGLEGLYWIAVNLIDKGFDEEVLDVAKLIPNTSTEGISDLRRIGNRLIDKGCVKEALDVSKLIPNTSEDGVENLTRFAEGLIGKGYVKEALDLSKSIPNTTPWGSLALESIFKKLAEKGEAEKVPESEPPKNEKTSSNNEVSEDVLSKKENSSSLTAKGEAEKVPESEPPKNEKTSSKSVISKKEKASLQPPLLSLYKTT